MARRGPKTIDPTPEEIAYCTRKIREQWSERTYRLRAGWTVEAADAMDQWTVPVISVAELDLDAAEDEELAYWAN